MLWIQGSGDRKRRWVHQKVLELACVFPEAWTPVASSALIVPLSGLYPGNTKRLAVAARPPILGPCLSWLTLCPHSEGPCSARWLHISPPSFRAQPGDSLLWEAPGTGCSFFTPEQVPSFPSNATARGNSSVVRSSCVCFSLLDKIPWEQGVGRWCLSLCPHPVAPCVVQCMQARALCRTPTPTPHLRDPQGWWQWWCHLYFLPWGLPTSGLDTGMPCRTLSRPDNLTLLQFVVLFQKRLCFLTWNSNL